MGRIEAAIEADLEGYTGCVDFADAGFGTVKISIDRLFTENGLAGVGRGRDELAVRARITRDEHRVDPQIIEDRCSIANSIDTVFLSHLLRRVQIDVSHATEVYLGMPRQVFRVEPTDKPGSNEAEHQHRPRMTPLRRTGQKHLRSSLKSCTGVDTSVRGTSGQG